MKLSQHPTEVALRSVARAVRRSRPASIEPLENRTLMSGTGLAGAAPEAFSAPAYVYSAHPQAARPANTYSLGAAPGGDAWGGPARGNVDRAVVRRAAPPLQFNTVRLAGAGTSGVVVIDRVGDVVTGRYVYGPQGGPAMQSTANVASAFRAEPTGLGTSVFDRRPHGSAHLPEKRRVLVVEDDGPSRKALTAILQSRGCQVTTAQSVAEGMAKLKDSPDALILDLMLPDGDGMQLLEHVRSSHLSTRVMVTTGSSDPTRLARVRDLHPDQLLSKPVRVNELLAGVMAV